MKIFYQGQMIHEVTADRVLVLGIGTKKLEYKFSSTEDIYLF